ncbi:MAG: hypothetical protein ACI82N_001487 [Maricaulis sp.]|jgi:hypothetical protein
MTEERFHQILSAYGANPARWPAAERVQAQAFAAANRARLASALALEAGLDDLLGPAGRQPGELLERRILRSLEQLPVRAWRAPALAAAAALILGVMLGFSSGALMAPADDVETYYADALTGLDQDWVDWLGVDA